ncbi:MAG: hypothetical protein AB7Y46_13785, partial [Armatimonadota bacterium]
ADPQGPLNQSREERGRYKAKLQRSVYAALPHYFGRDPAHPTTQIGARSDLYVYFYFHALSLLNDDGVFCFVTSNSWLDVDYGKVLQEFLARQVPMHLVIDNQVKRSFANADVNTVIVVFGAPRDRRDACLDHTARFVMALVPFEQVLDPVIIQEIEAAPERTERHEFRVFPRTQRELLEARAPAEERPRRGGPLIKLGSYEGDKWGGKYLRAPEIYWEILERAGDRLVPLGEIADVRRGFTTGANDWFFVRVVEDLGDGLVRIRCDDCDRSEHVLESEFVKWPLISKAREIIAPDVDPAQLAYRVVLVPEGVKRPPRHLAGYISWGEAQPRAYHRRPFFKNIDPANWFRHLGIREPADMVVPIGHKRRLVAALLHGTIVSDNLVEARLHDPSSRDAVAGSLFSTFTLIQFEVFGRANFGQGLLKTQTGDVSGLLVLDPESVSGGQRCALIDALSELRGRMPLMAYDDVRRDDRRALDDAFLAAVGFRDRAERAETLASMQDAACRMIWRRMAKSANTRESRQSYDEWLASGEPFDANAEDLDE